MQPPRACIHPLGAYRYHGATCDLLLFAKSDRNEPSQRRWEKQVNKCQQEAAAGRGPGSPGQGKGVCRPPVGAASGTQAQRREGEGTEVKGK